MNVKQLHLVGLAYNAGNVILLIDGLQRSAARFSDLFQSGFATAGALLFIASGLLYGFSKVWIANLISGVAALLLAAHLLSVGMMWSAVAVAILHAGGKIGGACLECAYPVPHPRIHIARRMAGLGPLLTRLPVLVECMAGGQTTLLLATACWLVADAGLALCREP